jgi:hypothetical protein
MYYYCCFIYMLLKYIHKAEEAYVTSVWTEANDQGKYQY